MQWFQHFIFGSRTLPFLGGWLADRILGDPEGWPHPVIGFGKLIGSGEKALNQGENKAAKGTLMALVLIFGTYLCCYFLLTLTEQIHPLLTNILIAAGVFFCLAGKTLIKEVKEVFRAVDQSVEAGRKQVARIVGRDTSNLSPQEIRLAALETLAENLSDGVIAPMFWFMLLGLPGMLTYKMINTLDSMIGYKNSRYLEFGQTAARIDDLANFIPARLTAWLMLLVSGNLHNLNFVKQFGKAHISPNSGYPEAALAAILNCRFGGTHDYFGTPVEKPYIGTTDRMVNTEDMLLAVKINNHAELAMGLLVCIITYLFY